MVGQSGRFWTLGENSANRDIAKVSNYFVEQKTRSWGGARLLSLRLDKDVEAGGRKNGG